jgi:hypothetical protein
MEPWEQNLQNLNNVLASQQRAATAAAAQATAREMARANAQQAQQNELMERLVLEQQIAGWSEQEKQEARKDKELGLDPLAMRSLSAAQKQQHRDQRRQEIQREEEDERAWWAEQDRVKREGEARDRVVGAVCILVLVLGGGWLWSNQQRRNKAEAEARELAEKSWQAEEKARLERAAAKFAKEAEENRRKAQEQQAGGAAALAAQVAAAQARTAALESAPSRAAEFHLKRAEAGDAFSQLELGRYYLTGASGVPKDKEIAVHWLKKAAAQGEKKAEELLKANP